MFERVGGLDIPDRSGNVGGEPKGMFAKGEGGAAMFWLGWLNKSGAWAAKPEGGDGTPICPNPDGGWGALGGV